MKLWILTIIILKSKLDALCEILDERIGNASLDMTAKTVELIDKLYKLLEKKRRVVNFGILYKRIFERLNESEQRMVSLYTAGINMQEIASVCGVCKATVCRRLNTAFGKGEKILSLLGFSAVLLKEEFMEVELIRRTYKMLANRHNADSQVIKGCNKADVKKVNLSFVEGAHSSYSAS